MWIATRIPLFNEISNFSEKELCRVQAIKSFNNGRYGNALDWALRSQDNLYVTSIADLFLRVSLHCPVIDCHDFQNKKTFFFFFHFQHYTKTGEILCEDVITNIGAKMFVSPRLVFLVKYCDFHGYHRRQQYAQAAELLVNLLDSKIAPTYFWPSMFADTISLLEAPDPIFSAKETHKIMHYLENNLVPLVESLKKSLNDTDANEQNQHLNEWEPLLQKATERQKSSQSLIENISFMVKIIRCACIRNLSRSIILENTNIS